MEVFGGIFLLAVFALLFYIHIVMPIQNNIDTRRRNQYEEMQRVRRLVDNLREKYHIGYNHYKELYPNWRDQDFYSNSDLIISEHNKFIHKKEAVINASRQYPHAFTALIKKLGIPSITGVNARQPGERKSNWQKKISEFNILRPNSSLISNYSSCSKDNITRRLAELQKRCQRNINTLEKEEYERLYEYINELESEEIRIKEIFRQEDIRIQFDDEILENPRRAKYYKSFASAIDNNKIIEYCVSNISSLDSFINKEIDNEYNRLEEQYKFGVKEYIGSRRLTLSLKEEIINNQSRIAELENIHYKYEELKIKYPVGLPEFERQYSLNNSCRISIEAIVDKEKEIALFDKYANIASFYKQWQQSQDNFSSLCCNLREKILSGWGNYIYSIPFKTINSNGTVIDNSFVVRQLFCKSFSEDETVEVKCELCQNKVSNRRLITEFLSNKRCYLESVYNKILSFIDIIKENSINNDDILVLLACSETANEREVIDFHFKYLQLELNKRDINYRTNYDKVYTLSTNTKLVIVDLITTNISLIANVESFINNELNIKSQSAISIVYISLFKGYSREEILELDKKELEKIKQQEEEAERIRREQIEQEKRRLQEEKARKEQEEKNIREQEERNNLYRVTHDLKSERNSIKEYLENHNIRCFYHFTDRRNLESIRLNGGLYSWNYCEKHNIIIPHTGGDSMSRSLDSRYGLEDYVRLSFCDNHPMMYRLKQQGYDLVLLKVNIDVALLNETLFSDMNATDNNHRTGSSLEDLKKVDLTAVNSRYLRSTDPLFKKHQAEVLVKTFIPIDKILNIDEFI